MVVKPQLSIVIPALNEAETIGRFLQALQPLRSRCEIIVSDGGSGDSTIEIAKPFADIIVRAPRGRARQMNAGAVEAQAETLLFLHADSFLPDNAVNKIQQAIDTGKVWGRFDVRLEGGGFLFKLIARMMNLRSRLTGIATGDQGIFMTRRAFDSVGGFPEIALMEDIAVSKKLKRLGKPHCIREKITTSARRWEQQGTYKTILLMWRLRWNYFFGAEPDKLAQRYYRNR